nr:MAG TPA: hypothetical protein [Caudoviricetes sp.]
MGWDGTRFGTRDRHRPRTGYPLVHTSGARPLPTTGPRMSMFSLPRSTLAREHECFDRVSRSRKFSPYITTFIVMYIIYILYIVMYINNVQMYSIVYKCILYICIVGYTNV